MRIKPLLTATFLLLTLCHVQILGFGTMGAAGIGSLGSLGSLGGFLGFGIIKLLKLKVAAFLVASLLKKFQEGGLGKPQTPYGGGGGGYPPVYPQPPPYGGGGGGYVGGGGNYRKRSVDFVSRRSDDSAFNTGLSYMYDKLAANDESLCIPRVVCEVNIAQARTKTSSSLESELLHLFRYYKPTLRPRSGSYNYFNAINKAFQLKEIKDCVHVFSTCKVPSVDLLQVIGRLIPKSSSP